MHCSTSSRWDNAGSKGRIVWETVDLLWLVQVLEAKHVSAAQNSELSSIYEVCPMLVAPDNCDLLSGNMSRMRLQG
jgi:hypothetical protein